MPPLIPLSASTELLLVPLASVHALIDLAIYPPYSPTNKHVTGSSLLKSENRYTLYQYIPGNSTLSALLWASSRLLITCSNASMHSSSCEDFS